MDLAELLGAESMLYLNCCGAKLVAKAPAGYPAREEDTIPLALDTQKLHLFDKETGQAIFH